MRNILQLELPKFDLDIDNEKFTIFVANNQEDRKLGLSGIKKLEPYTGMLFVFPTEGKNQMWMKDTLFSLDIIFLDRDFKILDIKKGTPEDLSLLGDSDNVKYVLEFPKGTSKRLDIQEGDSLSDISEELMEASDSVEEESNEFVPMHLLDEEGNKQMEIKGGERIFSRRSTKVLIQKAKDAKTDQEITALGRYVAQELIRQDSRDPEFTNDDSGVPYNSGDE